MAYVGTARRYDSPVYTLASILQGEAATEGQRGMQAVANVINNRALANFGGYGTNLVDQATANGQFQGQSRPSATAISVARQLIGGTLPDITGGATYYANPSASTAGWARNLNAGNALQIGNHFFTNNQAGVPFTGQVASVPVPQAAPPYNGGYDPVQTADLMARMGYPITAVSAQGSAPVVEANLSVPAEDSGPPMENIPPGGPYGADQVVQAALSGDPQQLQTALDASSAAIFAAMTPQEKAAAIGQKLVGAPPAIPSRITDQLTAYQQDIANNFPTVIRQLQQQMNTVPAMTNIVPPELRAGLADAYTSLPPVPMPTPRPDVPQSAPSATLWSPAPSDIPFSSGATAQQIADSGYVPKSADMAGRFADAFAPAPNIAEWLTPSGGKPDYAANLPSSFTPHAPSNIFEAYGQSGRAPATADLAGTDQPQPVSYRSSASSWTPWASQQPQSSAASAPDPNLSVSTSAPAETRAVPQGYGGIPQFAVAQVPSTVETPSLDPAKPMATASDYFMGMLPSDVMTPQDVQQPAPQLVAAKTPIKPKPVVQPAPAPIIRRATALGGRAQPASSGTPSAVRTFPNGVSVSGGSVGSSGFTFNPSTVTVNGQTFHPMSGSTIVSPTGELKSPSEYVAAMQSGNAGGSSPSSGGGTVLCTYFYRKGWLPRDLWEADTAFAKTLPRRVRVAYWRWAIPAVRRLQAGDRRLEVLLWPIVKAWAHYAGWRQGIRRFSFTGFAVHHILSRLQEGF